MTLLTIQGFDHLAAGNGVHTDLSTQPGWTTGGSFFSAQKFAGLNGGFGIQYLSVNTLNFTYNTGLANTTLIVGWKHRFPGFTFVDILRFTDSSNAIQCGIGVNTSTNKLFVWRGTSGTVIATGTKTMLASTWYGFEMKVNFSNTGYIIVKVDGVVDIDTGTIDTTNTANQNGQYVGWQPQNNSVIDDIYICNDQGAAPFNDFLGPCHIETLYPNSNNSVMWTPLSSTNSSQVSEVDNNGDTSYNSTLTADAIDTFNHPAITGTPSVVYACAVFTTIRKDDVAAQTANNVLISGATTTHGASYAPTSSYSVMVDIFTTDPNTGLAWNIADVNATKFGYRHV